MPLIFLLFTLNSTSKTLIICLTDKYVLFLFNKKEKA